MCLNIIYNLTLPCNLCISEEFCLNWIGLYKVMNEHVGEDPTVVMWPEAIPAGVSLDCVTGSRARVVTSPV